MATMRGSRIGKSPSVPRLQRRFSVEEAEASSMLLTCIKDGDIEDLHLLLSKLHEGITSVLNTPSLLVKHKLRTPLMAAAATGDFPRFMAIQHAFDRQFSSKVHRDMEMRTQLTTRDREGMNIIMLAATSSSMAVLGSLLAEVDQTESPTVLDVHDHKQMTVLMHAASKGPAPMFHEVHWAMRKAFGGDDTEIGRHLLLKSADDKTILMHAASSGDSMVLKIVADACQKYIMPQTLREMIVERDSDGLNLLMHAASCCTTPAALLPPEPLLLAADTGDEKDGDSTKAATTNDQLTSIAKKPSASGTSTSSGGSSAVDANGNMKSSLQQMILTNEAHAEKDAVVVPVFKVAVQLVKQTLWKDEVLQQLKAIDLWGRSVLTHALLSGHELMFEAAYAAVRDDVKDEHVSEMMEINEGEREDTPMIEALAIGDASMRKLFALRASQVKKDVGLRSKLSSMDAKIDSFIPGKLIVLFQLLLPQIAKGKQLLLLYIMCAIAPLLRLAARTTDPDSKHPGTAARSNKLSILLGAPAMFFWGIGTSTVGSRLGWNSALSATSMAAATLIIPAIDSFFNSSNAKVLGDKAYRNWRRIRKTTPAKPPHNELPSYSTFSTMPETTSSPGGVEEEKQSEPSSSPSAAAAGPSAEQQEIPRTTTTILATPPRGSPKDTFGIADGA